MRFSRLLTPLAQSTGFADEHIVLSLAPGPYRLRFAYHRRGASGGAACPVFPFELAVEPLDNLRRAAPLQAACAADGAPHFGLAEMARGDGLRAHVHRVLGAAGAPLDATVR